MQNMMKAAVLREFGKPLAICEKPIPAPGPGEVLIKVRASGLCVSDIHIQDGLMSTVRLPLTPGHEIAGEIAELGEGVNEFRTGDHVTAAIDILCGKCRYCVTGRTNLCRSLVRIGFERDGGHAEYCVIPAQNTFRVANWVPFVQITGIPDAVGCMYHAIKSKAEIKPGNHVLILGTGGLGMNAIQIAKLFGAKVYATSRQKDKLEVALQMGADAVINTAETDLFHEIVRLTDGELCDAVIDNIGIRNSIRDALRVLCPGGKAVISGYSDPVFEAEYFDVLKFEKEIIGMRGMTRQDMTEVIRFVEEKKIIPYVYRAIPFEQINEGLQMMRDGSAKGRVVLMME